MENVGTKHHYPFVGSVSIIKKASDLTGRQIEIDTHDSGEEFVKADHTVERIVWDIPGKHFPTFSYTLEDISEIMHSIRGQYIDLCKSTAKLESLCGHIDGMANTVRVIFLSTKTEKEERILETLTRHFKSENIIQKPKGCTLLDNLKEETKTDPFFVITTCNKYFIHYFRKDDILSRIIFLSDNLSREIGARIEDTLQHTTVANLLDKVDDLMENYFLWIFAQVVENYIVDCDDDQRAAETVRFANAIYHRSGLPEHKRPNFKIEKTSLVSKKVPMHLKHELVEIDQVIGCGEKGGVLIIDIKEKDCKSDEKAKEMVTEILIKHGVEKYHIYFPEIESHSRVEILSGEACNMNNQAGTLGAFVIEDSRDQQQGGQTTLAVLCAGHVVGNDDNAFLKTQNKNLGKVSCKYYGTGIDIAKIRVEEDMLRFIDVRFQNEANKKMSACLFKNDPSTLAGRCVFLRGASTTLGRGKISECEYISSDKCRYLEIVKLHDVSHYAEKGDSGATVLFLDRKGNFLHAVGMHLLQLYRRGNQLVYQALLLEDGINNLMTRDAALHLRLASSVEVEPHLHFTKLAVVEITRKYIRGVKSSFANIKDTETICTCGKEVEHLPDNLTPDEIVEKAVSFVQSILSDGLHTMLVIGTDAIDKATIERKFQNTAECSGMTHIEAIGYSCTQNDTQSHVLLNVDDGKITFFTSRSSQQATNDDSCDVYNSIRSKCLKKLNKRYEFKQNDKRNDEIKNVEEQFERKLLTFNGDADIHIPVLDSRNVCCDNAQRVDVIEVPKAIVIGILQKVCKEIETKVLDGFSAHGFTGNAVFHVYGMLTLCPKLNEILPTNLGGKVTKCICVIELPTRVFREAGKRLKCKCAVGLEGMRKQSNYIAWKELDSE